MVNHAGHLELSGEKSKEALPRFSVFPMISQYNDEYNDLLKFMNKKKLYLLHKTKVEMLFFTLFSLTKSS